MSPHERAYRRLLLLLPRRRRAEWGEDMVATYLDRLDARLPDDATDEDRALVALGRPGPGDALDVALLAVRLRLGLESPAPRSAARGDALRLLALTGLLVQAAFALVEGPGLVRSPSLGLGIDAGDVVLPLVVAVAWVVAYACLVAGRYGWARGCSVLALVGGAGTSAAGSLLDGYGPAALPHVLPEALLVLALLAWAPGIVGVPAPSRRWLGALPVVAVAIVAVSWTGYWLWSPTGSTGSSWSLSLPWLPGDTAGTWSLVVVLLAPIVLRPGSPAGPSGALALALGALCAASLRALDLLVVTHQDPLPWVAQALATAVLCAAAGLVARHRLRCLPDAGEVRVDRTRVRETW